MPNYRLKIILPQDKTNGRLTLKEIRIINYVVCGCNDAVHIAYESPPTLTIYSKNINALSKAVDEIKKDGYKIEGVISPTVVDTSPSIIMGK